MSTLAENAALIKAAQEAIDEEIRIKGGTTAGGLSNAAAAIAALPSGGGGRWQPPSEWPDIVSICDNDDPVADGLTTVEYPYKAIMLFNSAETVYLQGGVAWRTSDGTFVTTGGTYTFANRGYQWVISYSQSDTINVGGNNNGSNNGLYLWVYAPKGTYVEAGANKWRDNASSVVAIWGDHKVTHNSSNICSNCGVLKSFRGGILANSHSGFLTNLFGYSPKLIDLELDVDFAQAVETGGLFGNVESLERLPDEIDLKSATSGITFGGSCLIAVPTRLTINHSIRITGINIGRDSVATFAVVGGVLTCVGGLVGNLRSWDGENYVSACPVDGQTVTIGTSIKNRFGSEEQTAIAEALTSKNWGVVW